MSFTAKYTSTCPACGTLIEPGDEAVGGSRRTRHESCARAATAFDPDYDDDQPVEDTSHIPVSGMRDHTRKCPDCFTIHAGDCW